MVTTIQNISDVEAFAHYLVNEEKLSFHPDDDFNDYTKCDGKPYYSESEAELRNKLMDDCFEVCIRSNVEIYEIVLPIIQEPLLDFLATN